MAYAWVNEKIVSGVLYRAWRSTEDPTDIYVEELDPEADAAITPEDTNAVYNTNGIDGSTVTECSISGSTIRIYIDDPDNTTSAQRIYNWFGYYLFTASGIANQDGAYVSAIDSTHYVFDDSMKIVNQDTSNPLNLTGANITPETGPATNIFDLSNGASIALNFNRVEGFAYSSGSGLSPEEHTQLLAIPTTPLDTVIETQGSITAKQALALQTAVLCGVSTDSGSTFKTPDGASTRVRGTVNANNERISVTLTP